VTRWHTTRSLRAFNVLWQTPESSGSFHRCGRTVVAGPSRQRGELAVAAGTLPMVPVRVAALVMCFGLVRPPLGFTILKRPPAAVALVFHAMVCDVCYCDVSGDDGVLAHVATVQKGP